MNKHHAANLVCEARERGFCVHGYGIEAQMAQSYHRCGSRGL